MGCDHYRKRDNRFFQAFHPRRASAEWQRLFFAGHARHHGEPMKRCLARNAQCGFTLIELLVALGIFLLITGAAFTLLSNSQQRYQTESQVLNSFQGARLGLDQMVRDINDTGYPPPSYLASGNPNPFNYIASAPFAWSAGAGYPVNACLVGLGSCTTTSDLTPGDFDIIIETTPNPNDPLCAPSCQVQ